MRTIAQTLRDKTASNKAKQIVASCPFCGASIVSNAVLCLRCGRDLRSGRRLYDAQAERDKSNRSGGWFVWAVLATLVGALVYYVGWVRENPSEPLLFGQAFEINPVKTTPLHGSSGVSGQPVSSQPAARTGHRQQASTHSTQPSVAAPVPAQEKPVAQKKSTRVQVECSYCHGKGYTLTGFGNRQRKCLHCQGSGTVMRTVTTAQ